MLAHVGHVERQRDVPDGTTNATTPILMAYLHL